MNEWCDYWVEGSEQYAKDSFDIDNCVEDLVEAAKVIKQLRESILFWSYSTRQGMLQTCPERSDELKKFHESLDIHPA